MSRSQPDPPPLPDRTWPAAGPPGPKVLIEAESPAVGETYRRALRLHGYDAAVCSNPRMLRACPVLSGNRCPLADAASVVVFSMPMQWPDSHRLLDAHRALDPGRPICVELPEHAVAHDQMPSDVPRLRSPLSVDALVEAVERLCPPR